MGPLCHIYVLCCVLLGAKPWPGRHSWSRNAVCPEGCLERTQGPCTAEPPVPHFSRLGAGGPLASQGSWALPSWKGGSWGLSCNRPGALSSKLLPCFVLFLGISVKSGRLTHCTAFSCVAFIAVAVSCLHGDLLMGLVVHASWAAPAQGCDEYTSLCAP